MGTRCCGGSIRNFGDAETPRKEAILPVVDRGGQRGAGEAVPGVDSGRFPGDVRQERRAGIESIGAGRRAGVCGDLARS